MLKWSDLVGRLSDRTILDGQAWPREVYMIDGSGVESRGQLVNVSRRRAHVIVPVQIPAGEMLELRLPNRTSKGMVLYCRALGGQFLVALAVHPFTHQLLEVYPDERRQEPRFEAHEAITLTVISVQPAKSIPGRVVNISQSGLGLVLEAVVPPGELVEIRAASMVAFGEVRYCRSIRDGHFRVGVTLDETLLMDLRELRSSFGAGFLTGIGRRLLTRVVDVLQSRLAIATKLNTRSEKKPNLPG